MTSVKGLKDTIQWYDENAETYATSVKDLANYSALKKFSSSLFPHAKVLDAGCGSGRDSKILSVYGLRVTGIDISEGLLNIAKKENPESTFLVADLRSLPFSDNTFDGIWAHASLVHLETIADTKKAISEFSRVLKKNGILHIYVKEQLGKEKTAIKSDRLSHHERFFQYFTAEEIEDMLTEVSFAIQFLEHIPDPAGREDTKWIWTIAKK